MRTSHSFSRRAALAAFAATVVGGATATRAAAAPATHTAGAARTTGAPGPALAPVRVMPLGDSITDGVFVPGSYRTDLWQKFLAGGQDIDFVGSLSNGPSSLTDQNHEGHSGWTIGQIDSNISGWLATYQPQTILLHIGTNDMYGSDPGGAPNRLAALVDHITTQAPDTHLFVATIIPISFADGTVRSFNSQVAGIVQSQADAGRKVYLVDQYNALTTADLASDGIHPHAGGYSKMATAWYEALLTVPGSIGDGAA